MNRRNALKQTAIFAGGMALLPSCNFGPDREVVALENLKIDLKHQDLLAKVVDTIIPTANGNPGAEKMNLYRFVLVMVEDCESAKNQQIFVSGLNQIVDFTKKHLSKSFPQDDQKINEELVSAILEMDGQDGKELPGLSDIKAFVSMARRYTIQGYMSSQYIMTEKFPYQLVPGPFQACVSIDGLTVM